MKCVYVFSTEVKDKLLGMGYDLLWSDIGNETYIFAIGEDDENCILETGLPLTVSNMLLF